MPVVQGNIPGSAVFVPNEIEGAEDAVESVYPFLVDTKNNSKPARKKLIRRDDREYSQPLRFAVQLFFVALNLWIGVQFYLWVRWAESGGRALEVSRPAGVEGWLPIEGLMQSKYFLFTGQVPRVHAGRVLSCSCHSLLFPSSFASRFAVGCVRLEPSLNICGNWAAPPLDEISSCHAGQTSRYAR